jgi:hypothetical protein
MRYAGELTRSAMIAIRQRTTLRTQQPFPRPGLNHPTVEITRCLLCLANLPSFALDRLSRYGAALWRQVRQVLFALDAFDQERRCRSRVDDRPELPSSDSDDC